MHPIINKIRMLIPKKGKEEENYQEVPLKNSDLQPNEIAKQMRLKEIERAARARQGGGIIVFGNKSSTREILKSANDLRRTLQEHSRVNEMLRLHYVLTDLDEGRHVLREHDPDVHQQMYELEQGLKSQKEISDFLINLEKGKKIDWQRL